MKKFELVLVLPGSEQDTKRTETLEQLKKLIIDTKGEVENVEELGKKKFAYSLGKEEEGYYYSLNFATEKSYQPIIKKMKLMSVLRYLVLRR